MYDCKQQTVQPTVSPSVRALSDEVAESQVEAGVPVNKASVPVNNSDDADQQRNDTHDERMRRSHVYHVQEFTDSPRL